MADAATIGKENEAVQQKRGTPCIPGARLKSRPADLKEKITDLDGFREWKLREHSESTGSYRSIDLDNERKMVVAHSPKRARKDKNKREPLFTQFSLPPCNEFLNRTRLLKIEIFAN